MEINKEITAQRLKTLRAELGYTQEVLAEKLGVTWNKIKDIETARNKMSIEIAFLLEEKFFVNIKYLYGKADNMFLSDKPTSNILNRLESLIRDYFYIVVKVLEKNKLQLSMRDVIDLTFFVFAQDYRDKELNLIDCEELFHKFKYNKKFAQNFEEKIIKLLDFITRIKNNREI